MRYHSCQRGGTEANQNEVCEKFVPQGLVQWLSQEGESGKVEVTHDQIYNREVSSYTNRVGGNIIVMWY
jgi:hypothetical protein